MPRSFSSSMSSSICSCISRERHGAAGLQDAVGQRRLPVVDVGDDREVADEAWISHAANRGSYPDARSGPQRPAGPSLNGLGRRPRPLPVPQQARPRDHGGVVGRVGALRQVDRDAVLGPPGRERRAQLRVRGDAPGKRERADSLGGVDCLDPVETRAVTMARWKDASRSTSSASSASGSRGEPSIPRRWNSRSIAVFKPEKEKSREPSSTRPTGNGKRSPLPRCAMRSTTGPPG